MSIDPESWLNEKSETGISRIEVFGPCLAKNGGSLEVHGWGILMSYPPPFGSGLKQEEALILIELKGFLSGLDAAGREDLSLDVLRIIDAWIAKECEKALNPEKESRS